MTKCLIALCAGLVAANTFVAITALAQQPLTEERCPRMVAQDRPRIIPASFRPAALNQGEASLTYIGHSTFLIESAAGVKIATDYNDYVRPQAIPDIATMNRAHSSHFTNNPDPAIRYVLRGWGRDGEPARYDLQYEDVWVRNVVERKGHQADQPERKRERNAEEEKRKQRDKRNKGRGHRVASPRLKDSMSSTTEASAVSSMANAPP
jgi:hypothetical protein